MTIPLLDILDLRAFSSLWYWVVVGTLWARVSSAPLGVPIDMVRAAEGLGDQARDDLEAMADLMVRRRLAMTAALGPWRTAIWAFVLSSLIGLGVVYGLELAQALMLIAVPMAAVSALSQRTARRIAASDQQGEWLRRRLKRLKFAVQSIGLAAVFLTALWGMFSNLARLGV